MLCQPWEAAEYELRFVHRMIETDKALDLYAIIHVLYASWRFSPQKFIADNVFLYINYIINTRV